MMRAGDPAHACSPATVPSTACPGRPSAPSRARGRGNDGSLVSSRRFRGRRGSRGGGHVRRARPLQHLGAPSRRDFHVRRIDARRVHAELVRQPPRRVRRLPPAPPAARLRRRGDLALHPPGAGPVRIRSAHDAFVAFPPGTEHRVEPVRCDPGDWRGWPVLDQGIRVRRNASGRAAAGRAGIGVASGLIDEMIKILAEDR